MRAIVRLILAGILLLALSGMAGAAEWKPLTVTEPLTLSIDLPEGMDVVTDEATSKGGHVYRYQNKEKTLDVQVMVLSAKPDSQNRKYRLDSFTEEEKEDFRKEMSTLFKVDVETFRYEKSKSGHVMLVADMGVGLQSIVMVDSYMVFLQMRTADKKEGERIIKSFVF